MSAALVHSTLVDTRRDVRSALLFAGAAAVTVYYASRGGSYDTVPRQEEALVLWWVIALGAATGLLPIGRLTRMQAVAVIALGALALFNLVALRWTESDERTLAEAARTLHFLGIVVVTYALATRQNLPTI